MKTNRPFRQKLNKILFIEVPSVLALVAGFALTQSASGQAGMGGVNQLANPSWEIPAKAGWVATGDTPEVTDTATYYNAGECPADSPAETVVTHSGTNIANIYGNFTGSLSLSSWSQTLATAQGATWSAGAYTYCSHEDLMAGKNSFYYQVNFRDGNGVLLSSYQSYIITNLTCAGPNAFPLDTFVFLAVTNQMTISGGANTGTVSGTIASGILPAPPNATTVQFEALFVQQSDNAGGSVYLDDANLGLVSGAVPPAISAVNPNLVTLCTNTALTCTATSTSTTITNVQVTVKTSALGIKTTNTVVYGTNSPLLTVTGLGTGTANISFALTTNLIYDSVVVTATDAGGNRASSAAVTFDTLTPALVIEASDFNFSGGQFFDTPPNGGLALYTNQVGVEGIDEHKLAGSGSAANKSYYRPNDAVIVGNASPISGPSSTEQKFVTSAASGDTNDQEVEVGYNSPGDWLNFTRTYGTGGSAPAGTYNLWCYEATDGSGVQSAIYQVTSDPTQGNQGSNFLGNIGANTFSDNGWNSFVYVPMVDQFGNLLSVTLGAGKQTLRSVIVNNPNVGFYMLVPAIPVLTPSLENVYPDGLQPFESTNKLSITVGVANGASIASSGIHLIINGVDVTAQATITEVNSSWTVTYPLQLNQVYSGVLNVTNTAQLSSAFSLNFDTFNITNYQWEAVDYDFTLNNVSALYIDNPVPTCDVVSPTTSPSATNSYYGFPTDVYGAVALQGVDINFPNDGQGAAGTEIYRNDGVGSQTATDYVRPKFLAARQQFGDANIGPVNIGYYGTGYWMNYTRDWIPGNYYVWGRLAGGAGAFSGTTLSLVTSGVGTATQATNVLGTFSDPNAAGWQAWHWVPMLNVSGSQAVITLSGQETLKLTSGNNVNAEFLMLTPAPAEPALSAQIVAGQFNISIPTQIGFNYTVYYTSSLTTPNWQPIGTTITGDGTTHVVSETITGQQGYYQVR